MLFELVFIVKMSVYPSPESVVDAFSTILADDEEEGSPEAEVEKALRKVPPITSPEGLVKRFLTLVEVVHDSLVPCLIATPFVYPSEAEWTLTSHSDFRAERRKQLKAISSTLQNKGPSIGSEEILALIDTFEGILGDIFRVRIPAMPNYYITENFYDTVGASEIAEELIKTFTEAKVFDAKTRLQGLTKVLVRWFLLCPVGRPQVYVSDEGWTTANEKDIRHDFRKKLLQKAA